MNDIVFAILQMVVIISTVLTMRYLLPYLRYKLNNIIDMTVWDAIVKAVKSVEESIKGSGMGQIKKEEVIVRVSNWTISHGLNITREQLSQLIDTAVWIMKNEDKTNG